MRRLSRRTCVFSARRTTITPWTCPGRAHPLIADDEFAREKETPLIKDDADLAPRALDSGAPVLRLSREQSGRCRLTAEVDGEGQAPRWRVIEHNRPTRPGADRQLPALLVWRLLSADGGPANENGAVTFGVRCRQGNGGTRTTGSANAPGGWTCKRSPATPRTRPPPCPCSWDATASSTRTAWP
ncbi:hypothetical protein HML84_17525 [Alcanivorax sp. IO_7]|nr:hypothetical protein HML84_17525 [Alcanivorax sp. IO_7]